MLSSMPGNILAFYFISAFYFLLVSTTPIQQTVFAPLKEQHAQIRGKNAAVACEADTCSQIGIALNEAGGNAADMIVGTVLCIGVVAMYHAGIGGGGFALVHLPNGTHVALDFREAAPSGASPTMWEAQPLNQLFGGLAVGVPGELRGLEYIHSNFGTLPWATVVAPAIKLAVEGWQVNKDLERYMSVTAERIRDFFVLDPVWAEDFAPNGTRLGLGDTIRRPKFGQTLQQIARHGASVFYEGEMARQTVAAAAKRGGIITEDDLRNYKVEVREPVSIQYGNSTITSVPAPAGGTSVLSILKIMEGYDFSDGVNLTTHRLNEAFRFAYGGRAVMGDPAFVDRVNELEKVIIAEEYAQQTRDKLSDTNTLGWADYTPSGFETHDTYGTSHIVASDSSGLTISLTTTVNLYFGSGVMVPESGIILNDQMADFSTPQPAPPFYRPPAPANFAGPGKRPLSSMSPTIVTIPADFRNTEVSDNDQERVPRSSMPYLAIGAAGGTRIVTLVASLLLTLLPPYFPHATIAEPLSLEEALAQPRIHDSLSPNETSIELGNPEAGIMDFNHSTAAFLSSTGHKIDWVEAHFSAAQALSWQCSGSSKTGEQDCGFIAASDPRHLLSGARIR